MLAQLKKYLPFLYLLILVIIVIVIIVIYTRKSTESFGAPPDGITTKINNLINTK